MPSLPLSRYVSGSIVLYQARIPFSIFPTASDLVRLPATAQGLVVPKLLVVCGSVLHPWISFFESKALTIASREQNEHITTSLAKQNSEGSGLDHYGS